MSNETEIDQYASSRGETFDVVLCKKGVAWLDATPEDFRRVTVVSSEPYKALQSEEVVKAAAEAPGWDVLQAVPQGGLQEHEMSARTRAHSKGMGGFDPTKV